MARHGRGLICLTLTEERCRRLRLPLMVREAEDRHGTNFTVSIEAAQGVTTGISAQDRARTVRAAVAADARPEDLRQPGHVFPLMARPGGVLTRAGHTEAGLRPRAARRLRAGGRDRRGAERRRHDGAASRARAIRPRSTASPSARSRTSSATGSARKARSSAWPTAWSRRPPGRSACAGTWTACTAGCTSRWCAARRARRRRSCACTSGTRRATSSASAASTRAGRSARRSSASRASRTASSSLLRPEESPEDIIGAGAHEHGADVAAGAVLRTYGIGAQILRDLGVSRMRVLSAPRQLLGISAFGLEVTGYEE